MILGSAQIDRWVLTRLPLMQPLARLSISQIAELCCPQRHEKEKAFLAGLYTQRGKFVYEDSVAPPLRETLVVMTTDRSMNAAKFESEVKRWSTCLHCLQPLPNCEGCGRKTECGNFSCAHNGRVPAHWKGASYAIETDGSIVYVNSTPFDVLYNDHAALLLRKLLVDLLATLPTWCMQLACAIATPYCDRATGPSRQSEEAFLIWMTGFFCHVLDVRMEAWQEVQVGRGLAPVLFPTRVQCFQPAQLTPTIVEAMLLMYLWDCENSEEPMFLCITHCHSLDMITSWFPHPVDDTICLRKFAPRRRSRLQGTGAVAQAAAVELASVRSKFIPLRVESPTPSDWEPIIAPVGPPDPDLESFATAELQDTEDTGEKCCTDSNEIEPSTLTPTTEGSLPANENAEAADEEAENPHKEKTTSAEKQSEQLENLEAQVDVCVQKIVAMEREQRSVEARYNDIVAVVLCRCCVLRVICKQSFQEARHRPNPDPCFGAHMQKEGDSLEAAARRNSDPRLSLTMQGTLHSGDMLSQVEVFTRRANHRRAGKRVTEWDMRDDATEGAEAPAPERARPQVPVYFTGRSGPTVVFQSSNFPTVTAGKDSGPLETMD